MDITTIPTLSLLSEIRRRMNCLTQPEKNVLLIGSPGTGKGTQAQKLRLSHCYCHLSTGDLLREAAKMETDLGRDMRNRMDKGILIDDATTLRVLEDKLSQPQCRRGFILDGFPRNINQANQLEELLKKNNSELDTAILLDMPESELLNRIENRLIHPSSGRTYNLDHCPPKVPGKDDITGEDLIKRVDDNEETLSRRINIFRQSTAPLLDYYSKKGILHKVDASSSISEVHQKIKEILSDEMNGTKGNEDNKSEPSVGAVF